MNKNYNKNKYYKDGEIKQAKKLANDFYNKDYTPQLLRSGNKKLGSNGKRLATPGVDFIKWK